MPTSLHILDFLASPLWPQLQWSGTTFRCHPEGKQPPVMGLVFDNPPAAKSLFRAWVNASGNADPHELLRITLLEGPIPSLPPGYLVHLSPDPANVPLHALTLSFPYFPEFALTHSRTQFMHQLPTPTTPSDPTQPSLPPMLTEFKQQYALHRQFLLAPVTKHPDGQYRFHIDLGIEKQSLHFLSAPSLLADLTQTLLPLGLDLDALLRSLATPSKTPPSSPCPDGHRVLWRIQDFINVFEVTGDQSDHGSEYLPLFRSPLIAKKRTRLGPATH